MYTVLGFLRSPGAWDAETVCFMDTMADDWAVAVQNAGQNSRGDFQFVAVFEGEQILAGTAENLPASGTRLPPDRRKSARNYTIIGFHEAANTADVRYPVPGRSWVEASRQVFRYYDRIEDLGAAGIYQFVGAMEGRLMPVATWKDWVELSRAVLDPHDEEKDGRRAVF